MQSLTVYYRPDNYPDWILWREFTQEFNVIGNVSKLGTGGLPTARPGFAPRISFGKPADEHDRIETGRILRRGYNFQVKFVGIGHVTLDRFRLHAQKLVERYRAT